MRSHFLKQASIKVQTYKSICILRKGVKYENTFNSTCLYHGKLNPTLYQERSRAENARNIFFDRNNKFHWEKKMKEHTKNKPKKTSLKERDPTEGDVSYRIITKKLCNQNPNWDMKSYQRPDLTRIPILPSKISITPLPPNIPNNCTHPANLSLNGRWRRNSSIIARMSLWPHPKEYYCKCKILLL